MAKASWLSVDAHLIAACGYPETQEFLRVLESVLKRNGSLRKLNKYHRFPFIKKKGMPKINVYIG
jgi:hypothetical protein